MTNMLWWCLATSIGKDRQLNTHVHCVFLGQPSVALEKIYSMLGHICGKPAYKKLVMLMT